MVVEDPFVHNDDDVMDEDPFVPDDDVMNEDPFLDDDDDVMDEDPAVISDEDYLWANEVHNSEGGDPGDDGPDGNETGGGGSKGDDPDGDNPEGDDPDGDDPEGDDPEGDDPGDEPFENEEVDDDYFNILKYLSKEWLTIELDHRVSKVASEAMWDLAKTWFHKLFTVKAAQGVGRKTPSFIHTRRMLYKDYVPTVRMELGYLDKQSGDLTIVEDTPITPKSRFPSHRYQKLWEIAHVKVTSFTFKIMYLVCVLLNFEVHQLCDQTVKRQNP